LSLTLLVTKICGRLAATLVSLGALLGASGFLGVITAAAQPGGCDASAISNGLGPAVSVVRCHGDWAYVTTGGLGDSTMLAQLRGDGWSRYTGFPSSICKAQAAADGVPSQELSNFTSC
jgi:hypothetical protein